MLRVELKRSNIMSRINKQQQKQQRLLEYKNKHYAYKEHVHKDTVSTLRKMETPDIAGGIYKAAADELRTWDTGISWLNQIIDTFRSYLDDCLKEFTEEVRLDSILRIENRIYDQCKFGSVDETPKEIKKSAVKGLLLGMNEINILNDTQKTVLLMDFIASLFDKVDYNNLVEEYLPGLIQDDYGTLKFTSESEKLVLGIKTETLEAIKELNDLATKIRTNPAANAEAREANRQEVVPLLLNLKLEQFNGNPDLKKGIFTLVMKKFDETKSPVELFSKMVKEGSNQALFDLIMNDRNINPDVS